MQAVCFQGIAHAGYLRCFQVAGEDEPADEVPVTERPGDWTAPPDEQGHRVDGVVHSPYPHNILEDRP